MRPATYGNRRDTIGDVAVVVVVVIIIIVIIFILLLPLMSSSSIEVKCFRHGCRHHRTSIYAPLILMMKNLRIPRHCGAGRSTFAAARI